MAQPWGVSAMETTNEPRRCSLLSLPALSIVLLFRALTLTEHTHGSALHRAGESLKNALTPESAAETAKRNEALEEEHSVAPEKRNEAFEPGHRVGGTNLTVEKGTHHEVRR